MATESEKKQSGWFSCDNTFIDEYSRHFGTVGTSVYMALRRHADENGVCFPSQKHIAKLIGVSDRSVRVHLKRLSKANIIRFGDKVRRKNGKWQHNVYRLLDKTKWIKPEEVGSSGYERKISTEPEENTSTNQRKLLPTKNTNKNNTNKDNTHIPEYIDLVSPILDRFEPINGDYKSFHSDNRQSAAVERLIGKIGMDKLVKIMDDLPALLSNRFCPYITTPLELENKLSHLQIFIQRRQNNIVLEL